MRPEDDILVWSTGEIRDHDKKSKKTKCLKDTPFPIGAPRPGVASRGEVVKIKNIQIQDQI